MRELIESFDKKSGADIDATLKMFDELSQSINASKFGGGQPAAPARR